jgi:hypothetical protein
MPPRAMELPVKIPGVVAGAKQVRDLASAYKDLGAATRTVKFPGPSSSVLTRVDALTAKLERLAGAYQKVGAAGGGGFAAPSGGGSGMGGGRPRGAPAGTRFMSGPNQQLARIAAQRVEAQAQGNQAALRDLDILEFRAKRAKVLGERRLAGGAGALNGPGLLDLFGDLNSAIGGLRSGGFSGALHGITLLRGAEGGLNIQQKTGFRTAGLGNGAAARMLAGAGAAAEGAAGSGVLLGAARLAGPLAAAAAGAALFARATSSAGKNLADRFGAATVSGGSPGSIARLTSMGMAPGEIPGAAGALRGRLGGDLFGMMGAGRVGLGFRLDPRWGGDQDLTKDLIKAIKGLRELRGNPKDQLLQARRLGMEDLLSKINVSPRIVRAQDELAQVKGMVSPKTLQIANDFAASKGLAKDSAIDLLNAVGETGLPVGQGGELTKARVNMGLARFLRTRTSSLSEDFQSIGRELTGRKPPKMLNAPAPKMLNMGKGKGLVGPPDPRDLTPQDLAYISKYGMEDMGGPRAHAAMSEQATYTAFSHAERMAEMMYARTGRMPDATWKYRVMEGDLIQFGSLGAFSI